MERGSPPRSRQLAGLCSALPSLLLDPLLLQNGAEQPAAAAVAFVYPAMGEASRVPGVNATAADRSPFAINLPFVPRSSGKTSAADAGLIEATSRRPRGGWHAVARHDVLIQGRRPPAIVKLSQTIPAAFLWTLAFVPTAALIRVSRFGEVQSEWQTVPRGVSLSTLDENPGRLRTDKLPWPSS